VDNDRDTKLLSQLVDPVMKSLFRNMLDVESHFKAMIPEINSFIKAARVVCGVTENISGLVFQSCGADTGVLGMNVRGSFNHIPHSYHYTLKHHEYRLYDLPISSNITKTLTP
jgi:hypothetical protein